MLTPSLTQPKLEQTHRWHGLLQVLRQEKLALLGVVLISLYLFVALFGSLIVPYDPTKIDFDVQFASPSLAHPFGGDNVGRAFSPVSWSPRGSIQDRPWGRLH